MQNVYKSCAIKNVTMNKERTTLYINKELYEKIKAEAEKRGISINSLVVDIIASYFYESELRHHNCYEDHVTIWDGRMRRLVDVYFIQINHNTFEPRCSICLTASCPHSNLTKISLKFKYNSKIEVMY